MANFNLADYEPVEERIRKFYADHPEGRILTDIQFDDGKRIIFRATVYRSFEDIQWSTGYAEEVRGEGYVNKTSAPENCETSAIGRALANANYAGAKRPSREEMKKVTNPDTEKASRPAMLTTEQVTKLLSLAKAKGCADKAEATGFINAVLLTPDFTKLNPAEFEDYKKAVIASGWSTDEPEFVI